MNNQKIRTSDSLPVSSCDYWINLFCLIIFFAVLTLVHEYFPKIEIFLLATIGLLATVIPLWLNDFLELRAYKRSSTGLLDRPGEVNQQRIIVKLIGLYGTFFIILLLYHFNPTYRTSIRAVEYYEPFFKFLSLMAPWIMGLTLIYFWQMDRRQSDPYDGYWHMGCLLTGRLKEVNKGILAEYARGWFIKGFFTPIMFVALASNLDFLLKTSRMEGLFSFLALFDYILTFLYTIDLIYGLLGYILSLRLLDTHMQSTEPTLLGWIICLACYFPFSALLGTGFFPYEDGIIWDTWLSAYPYYPWVYYLWAVVILFLVLVYCLATVAFGYRMSNLTYRGLITSGPYRFTKHPAYICKVASWWMISMPFLSLQNPSVALHNTFNIGVVTLIYFLRAKTEENHLSNYPEYVQYAHWINEHGIFSAVSKHFPALQYSEEKAKRWKSVVWFKKLS